MIEVDISNGERAARGGKVAKGEKATKGRNMQLTALKAIGILLVVSCHLGDNLFNWIGIQITDTRELFPEYSYHMPLFVFASGYFYKRVYESDVWSLTKKRFTSIIKYMRCNLFYLVACFVLVSAGLYERHIEFGLRSLLVEPFLGGFQFYFNGAAWFVPFLFLVQVSYVLVRRAIGNKIEAFGNKFATTIKQEAIFLGALVAVGFAATWAADLYPVDDGGNVNIVHCLIRVCWGMQFFELGFFYKQFIEKKVCLSVTSFCTVIACKVALYLTFGYCTFSLRVVQFGDHVVLPVVVSVLGIAYCLHLAKFVAWAGERVASIGAVVNFIGENTWSIMMHHLFVKWWLERFYEDFGVSSAVGYFVSPVVCVVAPLVFVWACKEVRAWIDGRGQVELGHLFSHAG